MIDKIALIDIGSNSVRLVVYDCSCFVPTIVFNERALCALGADLESTNKLSVKGLDMAKRALKRFVTIANSCDEIKIFATSAVREAEDGKDFVQYIESNHGVSVNVLEAEEEARFGALGVISSITDAKGIVGDLGGGSLELAQISEGAVLACDSFPIGSLRVKYYNDNEDLEDLLYDFFATKSDLVKQLEGEDFYAVGGGFRALAKVYMDHISYPIKTVHNYKVSAKELQVALSLMSSSSIKFSAVGSKRANMIPGSAKILNALIGVGRPNSIVFSGCGAREGMLFDSLFTSSNKSDILLAGCMDIAGRDHIGYSESLYTWLEFILKDSSQQIKRIALASCYLFDIARRCHDKYKGRHAFDIIMNSLLIISIDHKSKVFLALILFHRYQTNASSDISKITSYLLEKDEIILAKSIGMSMRLACVLSANSEEVITNSRLTIVDGLLKLEITEGMKDFFGEEVQKRLDVLADFLDMDTKVVLDMQIDGAERQ